MNFKLLSVGLLLLASFVAVAQETTPVVTPATPVTPGKRTIPDYRGVPGDSGVLTKKGKKQQSAFESFNYMLPPEPKNRWEIGIGVGPAFESGDVRAQLGYGAMAYARKSLGYTFSLRGRIDYSRDYGLNWYPSQALGNNPVMKKLGYGTPKNPVFFYNYKANIYDAAIDGIITLNNIGFHKIAKDRKWNLYGIFGFGGMTYNVWYNAKDKNGNLYDYSAILKKYNVNIDDIKNRKSIIKDLKSLMDNTYETRAEGQTDYPSFKNRNYDAIVTGGLAVGYHLSSRFSLTLEYKVTNTRDRLLDGLRWQEHPIFDPALSSHWDTYEMGTLSLGYSLGRKNKSVEPLYWQNPVEDVYGALQALEKQQADQLVDTDGDGVPDKFDLEPNTPKGASVDTHGRTLDSDKDGVPDYLDKEPFTAPAWFPVDKEGYGTNGPHYKTNIAAAPGSNGGSGFGDWDFCKLTKLPDVNFDLDRYYIKPEFSAALHEVAMAMLACPNQTMVATGHTDVRETDAYNLVLSWNRVNKVIDYLTSQYGIKRDRFIVKFEGERKPKIPGLPDNSWSPIYEPRQYVNRRVEFHWADKGETGTSTPSRPSGTNAGRDY